MKTRLQSFWLVGLLLVSCVAHRSEAQILKVLHQFTEMRTNSFGVFTNNDGAFPYAGLLLSGNTVYGTASEGGSEGYGTVYAVNLDGSNFRNVHTFSATVAPNWTNNDGASPQGGLSLSGNTLYGTTESGGRYGSGTIFAVGTDGSNFRNLHSFPEASAPYYTNAEGAFPQASLAVAGQTLYGTTSAAGEYGSGTVFGINMDGGSFRTIHHFSAQSSSFPGSLSGPVTNSDGASFFGPLVISNSTLYGMAGLGGTKGNGTVFAVHTDGSAFTTLHNFDFLSANLIPDFESLTLSGATLYGVRDFDGISQRYGTVFRVSADGSAFSNVYTFTNDSEGAYPVGVLLFQNTLYGMTQRGSQCDGSVFAVNTDGTGFTNLYCFQPISGPSWSYSQPVGALILSQLALLGVRQSGSDFGGVFSLSFPPQLTMVAAGSNFALSWPTSYATFDYSGFVLESTANLASPFWTSNLPAPAVVNGLNTVTNPISATQQFFRLRQ